MSSPAAAAGKDGSATPPDPDVQAQEVARDLLKLQLEQREIQRSIDALDRPPRDLGLGVLPKTTAKSATIDGSGGGAFAALQSTIAVGAQAKVIARAVRAATTADDLIVIVEARNVANLAIAVRDLMDRAIALKLMLVAACRDLPEPPAPPASTSQDSTGRATPAVGGRRVAASEGEAHPAPAGAEAPAEPAGAEAPAEPTAGPADAPQAVAPDALGFALGLVDALAPSVALYGRTSDLPDEALRSAVAGELLTTPRPTEASAEASLTSRSRWPWSVKSSASPQASPVPMPPDGTPADVRRVILPSMVNPASSAAYQHVLSLTADAARERRRLRLAVLANASDEAKLAADDLAITKAIEARTDAVAKNRDAEAERLRIEIERLQGSRKETLQRSEYRERTTFIATATAALESVDAFVAAALSSSSGTSPLQQAALAEVVFGADRTRRRFLHLDITASGGDVLTTSSFAGAGIKVSGIAQSTFALTDSDGRVLAAGQSHGSRSDELSSPRSAIASGIWLIAIVLVATLAFAAGLWIIQEVAGLLPGLGEPAQTTIVIPSPEGQ